MNNSDLICRMKALKLLIDEFSHKKYASFVNKDIRDLKSGIKDEIGFQSESSDVELDITLKGCFIKYEYWNGKLDDYIKGEGELDYDVVIKEIENITLNIKK